VTESSYTVESRSIPIRKKLEDVEPTGDVKKRKVLVCTKNSHSEKNNKKNRKRSLLCNMWTRPEKEIFLIIIYFLTFF
jgi:hypothetical protein